MKVILYIIFILFILFFPLYKVLYRYNFIPHRKFESSSFNIEQYKSSVDKDSDGIDDQTDILNNAKEYIAKKPKYKSKYYGTGYPDDEYGVCFPIEKALTVNEKFNIASLKTHCLKKSRLDIDR